MNNISSDTAVQTSFPLDGIIDLSNLTSLTVLLLQIWIHCQIILGNLHILDRTRFCCPWCIMNDEWSSFRPLFDFRWILSLSLSSSSQISPIWSTYLTFNVQCLAGINDWLVQHLPDIYTAPHPPWLPSWSPNMDKNVEQCQSCKKLPVDFQHRFQSQFWPWNNNFDQMTLFPSSQDLDAAIS